MQSSAETLNDAWGQFLGGLARWDWFATFTFSNLVSPCGARYWFNRYLGWLENAAGVPVYAFRGDEYGPRGGRLHIHSLVGNVGDLITYCGRRLPPGDWRKRCCWTHAWPCGYARVLPYDEKLGARFYVSKYVTKQFGDWELYGFPAIQCPTLIRNRSKKNGEE